LALALVSQLEHTSNTGKARISMPPSLDDLFAPVAGGDDDRYDAKASAKVRAKRKLLDGLRRRMIDLCLV
jgi:hypothetical protein